MELLLSHQSALLWWRATPRGFFDRSGCSFAATQRAQRILPSGVPPQSPDERQLRALRHFEGPHHVLISDPKHRFGTPGLAPHVWRTNLPGASFAPTTADILVSTPAFCLLQLSRSLDEMSLLLIAYELCGTYRRRGDGCAFATAPVAKANELSAFFRGIEGVKGCRTLERLSSFVLDGSASPMETELALRLTLPYRMGGFGLPTPRLNHPLEASPRLRAIAGNGKYRADLYWPRHRVIVEYDSDMFHTGGDRIAKDAQRRMALETMGYTVIAVTRTQARNPVAFRRVALALARALDKRVRCDEGRHLKESTRLASQLKHRRSGQG